MEAFAQSLADALARELSLDKRDRDVAAYAIYGLFSVTFYTSMFLLAAWAFGVLAEAGAVALVVAVLRTFMGGAHLATAWRCGLAGAAAMTFFGFLGRTIGGIEAASEPAVQLAAILVLSGASLWAIGRYCPADVPQKPISHPIHRRNLRIVSRALLVIWATAAVYTARSGSSALFWSLVLGLIQQLLMVTPAGFGLCKRLDGLSEFILTRGGADNP